MKSIQDFARETFQVDIEKANDTQKTAIQAAYDAFSKANSIHAEISFDFKQAEISEIAEFVNYDIVKLVEKKNDISDDKKFLEIIDFINNRRSNLESELNLLYEQRTEIAKQIQEIKQQLGGNKTIRETPSAANVNRQQITSETFNSLTDCVNAAKSRRDAIVKMLEFLHKSEDKATYKEMKEALSTCYDLSTFKQDQSSAIRNVAKELNLQHVIKK